MQKEYLNNTASESEAPIPVKNVVVCKETQRLCEQKEGMVREVLKVLGGCAGENGDIECRGKELLREI